MIHGLDHIGIAVEDLDRAIQTFTRLLGVAIGHREKLPERNLEIAFFGIGDCTVELICPTNDKSPVHGFLRKKGEGLHHLAFKTDDINKAADTLREKGVRLAQDPAKGADGTIVLFLHPKDAHGVLIELVQKQ